MKHLIRFLLIIAVLALMNACRTRYLITVKDSTQVDTLANGRIRIHGPVVIKPPRNRLHLFRNSPDKKKQGNDE